MSLLASTIDVMLSRANITTVDAFAELLLSAPTFIANFIRSEAAAAAAAGRHAAEIGTMTDASVMDMGTQATADDAVDTATAEAMIAEALRMVDEANERERLAEERARSWQGYTELGRSLLQAAEDRTDRAQAEREVAERSAAAERAAKQMAEQLLAAEAALLRMRQRRALSMSAERAGRLRPKGMFGKLLQGAGAVEAVEVVVGMRHRHHRHRRHRHRRHRHHRRHHHRRHHHRCLS